MTDYNDNFISQGKMNLTYNLSECFIKTNYTNYIVCKYNIINDKNIKFEEDIQINTF